MIGSANFTEQAFSERKQYEELLVMDNSPVFEIFQSRFKQIYSETVDYVPEKFKRTLLGEKINIVDPEQLTEILKEELYSGKFASEFTQAQMKELNESSQKAHAEKEDVEVIKQIIEIVTKKDKKSGNHILLPKAQIEKKTQSIKSKLSRLNKKTEEVDTRLFVEYNESNHMLYKKSDEDSLFLFSKQATAEEIAKQLKLIHQFIDAYKTFTIQSSNKTQTRIFEAILYTFMSAHMWKVRDHLVQEEG